MEDEIAKLPAEIERLGMLSSFLLPFFFNNPKS